jgi:hypothetical protein
VSCTVACDAARALAPSRAPTFAYLPALRRAHGLDEDDQSIGQSIEQPIDQPIGQLRLLDPWNEQTAGGQRS